MNGVEFTVYGAAVPAGSKTVGFAKSGQHFIRDSSGKRGKDWRSQVSQAAGVAMQGLELLEGPLYLVCRFYVPRPKGHFGKKGLLPSARPYPTVKPDITKLLRAVEDSMTGIVYRDDTQIVRQDATKSYGDPARVEIEISAVR